MLAELNLQKFDSVIDKLMQKWFSASDLCMW